MSDKFEHDRFSGTCPTCYQEFLKERVELLEYYLNEIRGYVATNNEELIGATLKEAYKKLSELR